MIEFYNKFFSPSSSSRARISVHLHARGAGKLDLKIIDLLQSLELKDVPQEKRQSLDLLDNYLKEELGLPDGKRDSITSQAKELGLGQTTQDSVPGATTNGVSAVAAAQEIIDVRQYKAGLLASLGARPVKDLSEFEETDAKL